MTSELIRETKARCTFEPRGDNGLEGYQRGEVYRAQRMQDNLGEYWRVFPTEDDYYETCGVSIFRRYFKEVEPITTEG